VAFGKLKASFFSDNDNELFVTVTYSASSTAAARSNEYLEISTWL